MRSWPYYDPEDPESEEVRQPWWNRGRRNELAMAFALVVLLIAVMWLAAALGTWATGVNG